MNSRKIQFIITLIILTLASCQTENPLPILGSKPITDFRFLNQDSLVITNKTFDDKIYIANFFFTSCTTICPAMNRVMKDIFDDYQDNPKVMLLSHSIDFKYDTPGRLKKYAEKIGATGNKWQFAHGSKSDIYSIAEQSYMTAVVEDVKVKENFVHQGYLLLVDQHQRLRGAYDSDSEEQIKQLKLDIEKLLEE
ncbi:MAG TPA: SCO family protein [Pedobacter sp.]|nr:SCO family protein [Pedobacter sp.]